MGEAEHSVPERVRALIAAQLSKDITELGDDVALADIGVQSIDAIEIIFALEEKFNIEIPYNANDPGTFNMTTVGDVVASVQRLVDARG